MILFIEVTEDGQTVNHPMSEENLKCFFPDLDIVNPPKGFVRFHRDFPPNPPDNMRLDYVEYVYSENYSNQYGTPTYTDHYVFRPFNEEELNDIITKFKEIRPECSDWILDESTNTLIPPVPKPNDGKDYLWTFADPANGITESKWVEYKQLQPDNPELIGMLSAMQELQQEMGLPTSALDTATESITMSVLQPSLDTI